MKETALMLLILNYINILPIMSIDGGQIFNLFISRFPYFQLVFQIQSALVFLLLFGFTSLLLFLTGVFLLMAAFSTTSLRSLHDKLGKSIALHDQEVGEDLILRELFLLMNENHYGRLPFMKKFQMARSLLESYIVTPPPITALLQRNCRNSEAFKFTGQHTGGVCCNSS